MHLKHPGNTVKKYHGYLYPTCFEAEDKCDVSRYRLLKTADRCLVQAVEKETGVDLLNLVSRRRGEGFWRTRGFSFCWQRRLDIR